MSADVRRGILSIMYNTLKNNGELLLTVDLEKRSNNLWNMAAGKQVEDPLNHGALDSITLELESLGFVDVKVAIVSMPDTERVDIATITVIANK